MNNFQKEIKNEIMATDVFICVIDETSQKSEIKESIDEAFELFRVFESRFSRFLTDNELISFNKAEGDVKISDDLAEMIEKSLYFYSLTSGAFDISILPNLLNEGYNVSKKKGYYKKDSEVFQPSSKITNLILDKQNKAAKKPEGLKIDLGGIGKGYAIDKVSDFLGKKYKNFIVNAGGDIYASGRDLKNDYPYWAIDIENPLEAGELVDVLMISNKGVATSGVNRRKWLKNGEMKNHIIDPETGKSISDDLLSVTVVANSATEADALAKSLLIMGVREGVRFCDDRSIAAYFIDKNLKVTKSSRINKYVWEE